jgi:hypothetical protein
MSLLPMYNALTLRCMMERASGMSVGEFESYLAFTRSRSER